MILSFQLTMPNVASWNGRWTGEDKKYYVVKSVSKRFIQKQEYFHRLVKNGKDSWYYRWEDGWGANVIVEVVDAYEARKRRKISSGFCGYNWMIESIITRGEILASHQIKRINN